MMCSTPSKPSSSPYTGPPPLLAMAMVPLKVAGISMADWGRKELALAESEMPWRRGHLVLLQRPLHTGPRPRPPTAGGAAPG